jgi:hypothetical protein
VMSQVYRAADDVPLIDRRVAFLQGDLFVHATTPDSCTHTQVRRPRSG